MEGSAISTQNKKGFTYTLTTFGKAFINAASRATRPVMDIGAAYGVATLPALHAGAEVIAVDIEEKHLLEITKQVEPSWRERLITMRERLPDFDMPSGSLSAVYMSQVLPFLTGKEIEEAAHKIFKWLAPGGEAFVVSFTPYIKHVASFIPVYEERKRYGHRWAGYIDDVLRFSDDPNIYKQLPQKVHHIDADDLQWAFESAGFVIKEIRYFGEEEGALPEGLRYDGRERVGMIAYKPTEAPSPKTINHWQKISSIQLNGIPSSVREWLHKPYVLTKALKKVVADFSVQVSEQGIKKLYTDEVLMLKCFDAPYGYVRETYLGGENNPVVYARVSMPLETYQANKEELDSLGNRPIGETMLYKNSAIVRSELEVKRLTLDDELLFDVMVHDNFFKAEIQKISKMDELWARRSVFTIGTNQMLVTEVFLVNIPEYKE